MMLDPSGKWTLKEIFVALDVASTIWSFASAAYDIYQGDYVSAGIEIVSAGFFGFVGFRKGLKFFTWWNKGREIRKIFNAGVKTIRTTINAMREAGKPAREIAEVIIKIRNKAKVSARALMDAKN